MKILGSRLKFLAYLCLISEVFTGELVKTPDGNGLFITGRGCGGSTKIRYLTYVPDDLDKHDTMMSSFDGDNHFICAHNFVSK